MSINTKTPKTKKQYDPNLYDIIFFWNQNINETDDIRYKQYYSETLCNILGYTPDLAVKLIYEAAESGRSLIFTTRNVKKASIVRDSLMALKLDCKISPQKIGV